MKSKSAYYIANADRIKAASLAYYYAHKDRAKKYYEANKEKLRAIGRERSAVMRKNRSAAELMRIREYNRGYVRRRRAEPEFKLLHSVRHHMYLLLKGAVKSSSTLELLGMGIPEFKRYLQGRFKAGMTWENYGPVWHLDHIRPAKSYVLSDPAQQRECFHWSNYQPLFALENLRKGSKWVDV